MSFAWSAEKTEDFKDPPAQSAWVDAERVLSAVRPGLEEVPSGV